ncbi:MAG: acyl dehydratase [Actinobacteria bacterium]|nr:acyl dehydratase [Actinomycetota bacterium]
MQGVPPADVIRLMPNVWTEPFWRATAEHRMVVPRCTACGTFRLPPTPFCPSCASQDLEWVEHDGRGTIYSFTVIRHAVIPDVLDALPLIAAVVELPGTGGCRLVGNVVGVAPEEVRISQEVTVDWYDVREGETVPVFRLA